MAEAYNINIFVPHGDPEGIRIVSLKNWTGECLIFPRDKWDVACQRPEMKKLGVYILSGYKESDPDMPVLYIGQTDDIKGRLDLHRKKKDFWDKAIVFVSNNDFLNRAHITWLEWFLHNKATCMKRCRLDNQVAPMEPSMSESERADMQAFSRQMLQILPLLGIHAFEEPKTYRAPVKTAPATKDWRSNPDLWDTVIVPAKEDGFQETFIQDKEWYAIRIGGGMLERLKYIAAYRVKPVMAITHYAEIDRIEPYGDTGKYIVYFKGAAQEIGPIKYADAPSGTMQGPRYTNINQLKSAKTISELLFGEAE